MPRLHLGTGGRRPGRATAPPSSSAASRSSLSSEGGEVASAGATLDRSWAASQQRRPPGELDFDELDYSDNLLDGNGGNSGAGAGGKGSGAAKNKKRSSLGDGDSSSEEDAPLTEKSTARTKRPKSSSSNGSGGGAGGRPVPRRKPTATSPVITVADLSKKGRGANGGGKKPAALGSQPPGKPLGKPLPKASKSKGTKRVAKSGGDKAAAGDENVENRPHKKGKAGGKRKAPPHKQQQQPKGQSKRRGSKQKKAERMLELVDSDEESESSYDDSSSEEEMLVDRAGNRGKDGRKKGGAPNSKTKAGKGKGKILEDSDESSDDDDEAALVEKKRGRKATQSGSGRGRSGGKGGKDAKSNNGKRQAKQQQRPKQQGKGHGTQPLPIVLPRRALAIDNRAIPAVSADALARSAFLDRLPGLVEGGLERGVLSSCNFSNEMEGGGESEGGGTVLAALAHGAKRTKGNGAKLGNGRSGELVTTAVVPRAAYLFEGINGGESAAAAGSRDERAAWLAAFVAPVNSHLGGGDDGIDVDEGLDGTGFDYGTEDDNEATMGGSFDAASGAAKYRGPTGFAAGESWGCFGDLVEAIEDKLSDAGAIDADQARHATLFTTDANLFADVRSSAHLKGLEQFWKRLQASAFGEKGEAILSAVTIVVVETTTIQHVMKRIRSGCDDDVLGGRGRVEANDLLGSSSSLLPSRLDVIQCVNDIRQRINELSQAMLESLDGGLPIDLQLEFVEGNGIAFQSVLQQWTNKSFAQTFASSGVQGRLSFDLPETLDGISCSISLDLQPTVLPCGIRSPHTASLVDDLRRISLSSVEVVQTLPLSSVDSSLIYGVPLAARAGADGDASRHEEMRLLARQLWRYLGRNDAALMLRARADTSEEDSGGESASEALGYHSGGGEQMFLLVCEESVQKPSPQALDADSNLDLSEALKVVPDARRRGEAPSHGMLYRYATKSQVLRFGNEDGLEQSGVEEDAAVSEQYADYIERSLDTLVNTGLNPLLMGGESIVDS